MIALSFHFLLLADPLIISVGKTVSATKSGQSNLRMNDHSTDRWPAYCAASVVMVIRMVIQMLIRMVTRAGEWQQKLSNINCSEKFQIETFNSFGWFSITFLLLLWRARLWDMKLLWRSTLFIGAIKTSLSETTLHKLNLHFFSQTLVFLNQMQFERQI